MLARLQGVGQTLDGHEWGVLGTAAAAFSHCEGPHEGGLSNANASNTLIFSKIK